MSAVEEWALDGVRTHLRSAGERSETVSFDALREGVGLGHGDLAAVLDSLREAGEAREEAPGEWTSAESGPRTAPVADPEAAARAAMDRADGREPGEQGPPLSASTPGPVHIGRAPASQAHETGEVVLTMAVASALDAETIGKLVEAGIAEAKEGDRAFVLRVVT